MHAASGNDVDQLMRPYGGAVPGASLAVIRDGEAVLRRSYGCAELETGVPATAATNYRLASLTKQFTAAAVLLLADRRDLSLEDSVRGWLPTLPAATAPITIRQLLTHTSGLVDYEAVIPQGTSRQLHDADVLALLEPQNRTYFEPGTRYRYSNGGYALLALVVERASGSDFASFMHERVFAPLGMCTTVAYREGGCAVAHRAYGYRAAGSTWQRADQSLTSAVLGDGGIYSSTDDLERWDAALHDTRLLSAEALRLSFAPSTPTEDPAVHYGFGWRITGETVWHSGETLGFRNVIVRYPRRRFTVIILTNRSAGEPYQLASALAREFLPTVEVPRVLEVMQGPDPDVVRGLSAPGSSTHPGRSRPRRGPGST